MNIRFGLEVTREVLGILPITQQVVGASEIVYNLAQLVSIPARMLRHKVNPAKGLDKVNAKQLAVSSLAGLAVGIIRAIPVAGTILSVVRLVRFIKSHSRNPNTQFTEIHDDQNKPNNDQNKPNNDQNKTNNDQNKPNNDKKNTNSTEKSESEQEENFENENTENNEEKTFEYYDKLPSPPMPKREPPLNPNQKKKLEEEQKALENKKAEKKKKNEIPNKQTNIPKAPPLPKKPVETKNTANNQTNFVPPKFLITGAQFQLGAKKLKKVTKEELKDTTNNEQTEKKNETKDNHTTGNNTETKNQNSNPKSKPNPILVKNPSQVNFAQEAMNQKNKLKKTSTDSPPAEKKNGTNQQPTNTNFKAILKPATGNTQTIPTTTNGNTLTNAKPKPKAPPIPPKKPEDLEKNS